MLPQFALFQADGPSKDEDSEVQDPMKFAIEQAIKTVEHAAKVRRPEFKQDIIDYYAWAEDSEKRFKKLGLQLEAKK